jgi:hypothetical protein
MIIVIILSWRFKTLIPAPYTLWTLQVVETTIAPMVYIQSLANVIDYVRICTEVHHCAEANRAEEGMPFYIDDQVYPEIGTQQI